MFLVYCLHTWPHQPLGQDLQVDQTYLQLKFKNNLHLNFAWFLLIFSTPEPKVQGELLVSKGDALASVVMRHTIKQDTHSRKHNVHVRKQNVKVRMQDVQVRMQDVT
jgi:hypothetical protein